MREESLSGGFKYGVAIGWLRDLASEPTPTDPWPCVRWDAQLLRDQENFLEVQSRLGQRYNVAWGLFISRCWPVPFERVVSDERRRFLASYVAAAHARGVKVMMGTGIYSWGFEEVIRKVPGVAGGSAQAMCASSDLAWDWQRRVLDFIMDPQWGLDGLSMQSADQGRCDCPKCAAIPPAEYHARILIRCAEHVRAQRPDWVIGQACWGVRVDRPEDFPSARELSRHVDYMVEVKERSAGETRRKLTRELACPFGSLGGVFVEPPQHWDRLRWFLPCGVRSARLLRELWREGGTACEYFYRPFANPVEEVSWRVGARILAAPETTPEESLREAVEAVYGAGGAARDSLADWFARGEDAYFSRAEFQLGIDSLSLEPLIWKENPAASGPAVYLSKRMSRPRRADYARELEGLKAELAGMKIPRRDAARKTAQAIDGTLKDLSQLSGEP